MLVVPIAIKTHVHDVAILTFLAGQVLKRLPLLADLREIFAQLLCPIVTDTSRVAISS